jgi:hypothetical protein
MAKRIRRRKVGKPRGMKGRNPTGEGGAKVSEYPQTTIRLPPDVRELLERVAAHQQRQQWRVLVDAIRAYAAAQGVN